MYSDYRSDIILALVCVEGTDRHLPGWIPPPGILHGRGFVWE